MARNAENMSNKEKKERIGIIFGENDYIIRGTAADNQLRVFAATTRGMVEQARASHGTSPVATAALGRLLTAGAMMGSMMKGEKDLLTLKIDCDGPIGGLTVTADSAANVKGYVGNREAMLPPNAKGKLDVGGAVGAGVLNVIRDIGMKEPYNGRTPLVSGEIAEDLTYYFATSEQVPSAVALGVLMEKDNTVKQAGGFIIQVMPFIQETVIDRLEKKLAGISSVTGFLDRGMAPEEMMEEILGEFGLAVMDRIPTRYHCDCSKEKVSRAIASISRRDLDEMIREGEPIEVKCQFCNSSYVFGVEELADMSKSDF